MVCRPPAASLLRQGNHQGRLSCPKPAEMRISPTALLPGGEAGGCFPRHPCAPLELHRGPRCWAPICASPRPVTAAEGQALGCPGPVPSQDSAALRPSAQGTAAQSSASSWAFRKETCRVGPPMLGVQLAGLTAPGVRRRSSPWHTGSVFCVPGPVLPSPKSWQQAPWPG